MEYLGDPDLGPGVEKLHKFTRLIDNGENNYTKPLYELMYGFIESRIAENTIAVQDEKTVGNAM